MAGKIAKERLESSLEKMNEIYDRQDVEGQCVSLHFWPLLPLLSGEIQWCLSSGLQLF